MQVWGNSCGGCSWSGRGIAGFGGRGIGLVGVRGGLAKKQRVRRMVKKRVGMRSMILRLRIGEKKEESLLTYLN